MLKLLSWFWIHLIEEDSVVVVQAFTMALKSVIEQKAGRFDTVRHMTDGKIIRIFNLSTD